MQLYSSLDSIEGGGNSTYRGIFVNKRSDTIRNSKIKKSLISWDEFSARLKAIWVSISNSKNNTHEQDRMRCTSLYSATVGNRSAYVTKLATET
jgi:hypothetical protein